MKQVDRQDAQHVRLHQGFDGIHAAGRVRLDSTGHREAIDRHSRFQRAHSGLGGQPQRTDR